MRIALFTDTNIHYTDGVGRIIHELIGYASRNQQHSLLVFYRSDAAEQEQPLSANVAEYGVDAPYLPLPGYRQYPYFYLRSPRRRLLARVQEFAPDIVLTVTPYVPQGIGRAGLDIGRRLRCPVGGSFDFPLTWGAEYYIKSNVPFEFARGLFRWHARFQMRVYRGCDVILVPSAAMAQYVHDMYGDVPTIHFPRAVDSHQFHPRHRSQAFRERLGLAGKVVVLFVGRLALEKNLLALADAYQQVKEHHAEAALLFVGEGPVREALEQRRLSDVRFAGPLRGQDLLDAYASADVFAFPSVADAGPMVILEAMASGLPALVQHEGGGRDCVTDGRSGFVAKQPVEFAVHLEQLVGDAQLRSRMGREARADAEAFSWENVWPDVIGGLEEVVASRGISPVAG